MPPPNVPVLGIGNVLWSDEGFGVRAVEMLNQLRRFPDNVLLIDGGTQGIHQVQHVQVALDRLSERGVIAQERLEPLPDSETLNPYQLELDPYETGHPSAALTCRHGGARVLRDSKPDLRPKA